MFDDELREYHWMKILARKYHACKVYDLYSFGSKLERVMACCEYCIAPSGSI
jgi:hypothetical protein